MNDINDKPLKEKLDETMQNLLSVGDSVTRLQEKLNEAKKLIRLNKKKQKQVQNILEITKTKY